MERRQGADRHASPRKGAKHHHDKRAEICSRQHNHCIDRFDGNISTFRRSAFLSAQWSRTWSFSRSTFLSAQGRRSLMSPLMAAKGDLRGSWR